MASGFKVAALIATTSLLGLGVANSHRAFRQADLPEVRNAPRAPGKPEPVTIAELPLPPGAPSLEPGSCTIEVNPHGTGCINVDENGSFEGPSYMWDGKHVLMPVEFAGAPAGGIYSGHQVLAIKTDGTLFSSGDGWKCITCGVPAENTQGAARTGGRGAGMVGARGGGGGGNVGANIMVDHPQAFWGDERMIAGTNVIECGRYTFTDLACTPELIHIYPMRWNTSAEGSGNGGSMRELRLSPDSVHLAWNSFTSGPAGLGEYTGVGTLVFNPAPTTGPQGPRYDLEKVTLLYNQGEDYGFFRLDPKNPGHILFNKPRGVVGESRGWSGDGQSVIGTYWEESGNMDVYMTSLATGESRRLTRDAAYTDPMHMSPDNKWDIILDNRQGERHMYFAAMRGIPPLVDSFTSGLTTNFRNGNRRFFQPYLIDSYGDRGDYHGQQLNAGPGTPGSPSDPNWNARADPTWSPDGTSVVYWQNLVSTPACGGKNPLPCPESTAPGGRRTRLMIAHLTSRKPQAVRQVPRTPDLIPWATPYQPGDRIPLTTRAPIPAGKYILQGKVLGQAEVEFRDNAEGRRTGVSVRYHNYSDDGGHIIDGTESAERVAGGGGGFGGGGFIWHSDIRSSGLQVGTKLTSPDGFRTGPNAGGSLTTTINGKVYTAPSPGT